MTRNYSLFEKLEGKWQRMTSIAMPKQAAVRFFQNQLLSGSMQGRNMALRPVPKAPDAWGNPQ